MDAADARRTRRVIAAKKAAEDAVGRIAWDATPEQLAASARRAHLALAELWTAAAHAAGLSKTP